tara:strand:+ start:276 stop:455 length:180 start_codon:yes stop_codon:yes gene_type:complete
MTELKHKKKRKIKKYTSGKIDKKKLLKAIDTLYEINPYTAVPYKIGKYIIKKALNKKSS